jgi:hypothetical protein
MAKHASRAGSRRNGTCKKGYKHRKGRKGCFHVK